ncbi:MAG: molybdopterin-dependent oxidoreductase [Alphaproteobacteria bacterium]|nr:molybdopterin-dependent oxidoreductase [Alphaproteobacteria bacterium]
MNEHSKLPMTSYHWGTFRVETRDGQVTNLIDFEEDPAPSAIGQGLVDVLRDSTRIDAPMVRRGWLENGPGNGAGRGAEPFVRVSWDEAEKLVADELARVCRDHGNQAIYSGSYGWASAGSFHLAQAQLYRFLNCIGGFTKSLNSYSFAAGEVIMPHVLGGCREFIYPGTSWKTVVADTELFVAFGGVPVRNGQMAQGGLGRHRQPGALAEALEAGVRFVNISPIRDDIDAESVEWLAPRPGTDVAILLGLAHTLLSENLHDQPFLKRYSVGFERYSDYLNGKNDGIPKSAQWAADISGLEADAIRDLARRMAAHRTMISASWSLTRQDRGEHPFWAAIALAAMLGQMGLPGGGIGFGYSALNSVGNDYTVLPSAAIPVGENPVEDFIPVARISDMLLNPGAEFDYDGQRRRYPEAKIVYWAGGNPFHHHQDLNRLLRAWTRPDTIIAHEWCWNAHARHADVVLPCTTAPEREDIALTPRDGFIVHMEQAVKPFSDARDDYDIFRGIADRMGVGEAFSEGRTSRQWLEHLYDRTRQACSQRAIEIPAFEELRSKRWFEVAPPSEPTVILSDFRANPEENPLNTPSGKIELFSQTIADFGYADCPGHPFWAEPYEWLGRSGAYPLHLISNQPKDKLHSQLDHGSHSRAAKIDGREPVHINPADAAARGVTTGTVVRVFNDRGACYCGAVLDDTMRPGVIRISTGAWFDPETSGSPTRCKRGNPNMLTRDRGTSQLAQGPTAQTCLVELERAANPPEPERYGPPDILDRGSDGV